MSAPTEPTSSPAALLSKQLCFSTLVCPNWSLQQIVDGACGAGIAGIDFRGIQDQLDITRHPAFAGGLDQTMALLANRNLRMPCLNSSIRLVERDAAAWPALVDEFERYVALAARTGTRMIRVFGGAVPDDMTRDDARNLARVHLQQLVQIAAGRCLPVIETHDAWRTTPAVLELLDGCTPHAGVLWDIEHTFRAGESPDETVRGLGGHLQHVHVKDSRRPNGIYQPLLLGEGEFPVAAAVRALVGAGYQGWICLETEKRWHPSAPEPEESVPQFAKFVRSLLCTSDGKSAS